MDISYKIASESKGKPCFYYISFEESKQGAISVNYMIEYPDLALDELANPIPQSKILMHTTHYVYEDGDRVADVYAEFYLDFLNHVKGRR